MSEILDSGSRRTFSSGAVRDIQVGKGKPSYMPLDVVAEFMNDDVLREIAMFQQNGVVKHLFSALNYFSDGLGDETMMLDVSIHYEKGVEKYGFTPDGTPNWKLGIPSTCYLDSMVRHYLKWRRGDDDEDHYRAFVWNVMCCIWTCCHKPEYNDLAPKTNEVKVESTDSEKTGKVKPIEHELSYADIITHIGNHEDDRR